MNFKFNNGDRVKHRISGFTGIIMCRTEWLNGCRRYALGAETTAKDSPPPSEMPAFDEQELELLKVNPLKLDVPTAVDTRPTGGPFPAQRATHSIRKGANSIRNRR